MAAGISPRLGTGLTPAGLLLLLCGRASTAHLLCRGVTSALHLLIFGVSTTAVMVVILRRLGLSMVALHLLGSSSVVVHVLRLLLGFCLPMLGCRGVVSAAVAGSMVAV